MLHGSLLNRNALVLFGGDPLDRCACSSGACFCRWASRWSVDSALSRAPLQPSAHLSWASAGLLLQVLSVYFFSALLKTGREWWPEGTAVWYALSIDGYITPAGEWLRDFSPVTQALTYLVYFLELLGPPLAIVRIPAGAHRGALPYGFADASRFAVMVLLAAMHAGFIVFLSIGRFPFHQPRLAHAC